MSPAVLDLATNRNPRGPAESVRERLRQASGGPGTQASTGTPDPEGTVLRMLLGDLHGHPAERILLGHGSMEILRWAVDAAFPYGGSLLLPRYSYDGAAGSATRAGLRLVETPASPDEVDVEALLRAVRPDTRLVYLANVNNPTGTWVDADALPRLIRSLREDILLVVDQAYAEYEPAGGFPDAVTHLPERERLLVLHTFSKLHGLDGLRTGYGLGTPWVVECLAPLKPASGLDPLRLVAAEAAIRDRAFVEGSRQLNARARTVFFAEAERHRCHASGEGGNFVLMETLFPAQELAKDLLRRGVAVRSLHDFGLPQHVRISLGTPEQMDAFWRVASPLLDGCGCSRSL